MYVCMQVCVCVCACVCVCVCVCLCACVWRACARANSSTQTTHVCVQANRTTHSLSLSLSLTRTCTRTRTHTHTHTHTPYTHIWNVRAWMTNTAKISPLSIYTFSVSLSRSLSHPHTQSYTLPPPPPPLRLCHSPYLLPHSLHFLTWSYSKEAPAPSIFIICTKAPCGTTVPRKNKNYWFNELLWFLRYPQKSPHRFCWRTIMIGDISNCTNRVGCHKHKQEWTRKICALLHTTQTKSAGR